MNLFSLDSAPSPYPLSQKYGSTFSSGWSGGVMNISPSITIEEIEEKSPPSLPMPPKPTPLDLEPPSPPQGLPSLISSLTSKSKEVERARSNTRRSNENHTIRMGRVPRNLETTIEIKELNMDLIYPSATPDTKNYYLSSDPKTYGSKIAIIGKPGSGKSWLARYICFIKRHMFPAVQVHSGTEMESEFYGEFVPKSYIFHELDYKNIKKFIMRQKLMRKYKAKNPWGMLVKDDVMKDTKLLRDVVHVDILKNGRHWKMLYILIMQYCLDLDPQLRTCFDGAFILREDQKNNLKKLHDNFASAIPDFTLFCRLMKEMTKDYRVLYVSNDASISGEWYDKVFWFKPEKVPEFKMCCPEAWDYSNAIYDQAKATQITDFGNDDDILKELKDMMKSMPTSN